MAGGAGERGARWGAGSGPKSGGWRLRPDCTWRPGGGGAGAATRAAAAAVWPGGAWAGVSAPLPAPAAVNRARTPGQGPVSEDKALALLITSQDLEPGPKSRSGAGRPGRGSLLRGREERQAEPRRHGGDFPPPCLSPGQSGLSQPSRGLGCSCRPSSPPARSLGLAHPPSPPWPLGEPRPDLARCGPQALAKAARARPGRAGHRGLG